MNPALLKTVSDATGLDEQGVKDLYFDYFAKHGEPTLTEFIDACQEQARKGNLKAKNVADDDATN